MKLRKCFAITQHGRTHGRSLKIDDLKDVLLIERILADIIYRIKTVVKT
jgi:hypothetical protein